MDLKTEAQYRQELATCWQLIEQSKAYEDGLRKDAERYRWLRNKSAGEIVFDNTNGKRDGGDRFVLPVPFNGEPISDNVEQGLRLDASIDAAMAADAPGAA